MVTVKELCIGAHVFVNGVRARVIDIHKKCLETENFPYQIFVEGIPSEDGIKKVVGGMCDGIDPIPITPKLLEELGFEKINEHGTCSGWKRGDIQIAIYGERVELYIFACIHVLSIRYLHELESIVYLTTKQELIKE